MVDWPQQDHVWVKTFAQLHLILWTEFPTILKQTEYSMFKHTLDPYSSHVMAILKVQKPVKSSKFSLTFVLQPGSPYQEKRQDKE